MILSASRRTDIPAFYGEWLENRLREGRVQIPNPYRPRQVRELRFSPDAVDCLVFWTKDARPLLPRLGRIAGMGYAFYFQHTLTPYGPEIEPGICGKRAILEGMKRIGAAYGPDAMAWRYDPVLLGQGWDEGRHLEAFGQLCRALKGYAGRCVMSFLDLYPGRMDCRAFAEVPPEARQRLAEGLGKIAAENGMPLYACAEEGDYARYGILPSACIDPVLASKAAGRPVAADRDGGQRPGCGCAESIDIGMYGSCLHGCRYCYASGGRQLRSRAHNPSSLRLLGEEGPEDTVRPLVLKGN